MRKILPFLCLISAVFAQPLALAIKHTEPRGIGFYGGYTSLEVFYFPCRALGSIAPYGDLRMHIFNDGKPALNFGLGARGGNARRLWGGNIYYDFRRCPNKNFHQVAFGLESLGMRWAIYANGYVGIGAHDSHPYHTRFGKFQDHHLLLKQTIQSSLSGGDIKTRYHFLNSAIHDVYLDSGGYYFTGKRAKNVVGLQMSLGANLGKVFFAQASTSWDWKFKWLGQGVVGVQFSLWGGGRACRGDPTMRLRSQQFPSRQEIIPVVKHRHFTTAIDPNTGAPYSFLFVDNTHPFSDGSYEDPFGSLAEASSASREGDVLYIFRGDGTSNRMSGGITLLNRQQLLGSGTTHRLATSQGTVSIPAQTEGMPVLSNSETNGNAITLADNSTVAGIHIDAPDNEGIVGVGIQNALIQDNLFTRINNGDHAGTERFGINIRGPNLRGTHIIARNTFIQAASDSSNVSAIYLQTGHNAPQTTDTARYFVHENIAQVPKHGVQFLSYDASETTLFIQNNIFSTSTEACIDVQPHNTSSVSYEIRSNTLTCPAHAGLNLQGRDTSFMSGSISLNQFDACQRGFQFDSGGSCTMVGIATGNTFTNNTTFDFRSTLSDASATLNITFRDNAAPQHGFTLDNDQATGTLNATFHPGNTGPISQPGTETVNIQLFN